MSSNQAEQDAAWIDEHVNACRGAYDNKDAERFFDIAARIREGQAEQPDAECVSYTPTPVVMELGPETMEALREGFALVAAASNEAHEESYVPTWLAKSARILAAAMTPGEGEPWDGSLVKADTELAAAREANRELNQRIAAARALLEQAQEHVDNKDHPLQERIDTWLKGQGEAATSETTDKICSACGGVCRKCEEMYEGGFEWVCNECNKVQDEHRPTPPLNAEKVAERCVVIAFDSKLDREGAVKGIAAEIRKEQEQGDEAL